MPFLRKYGTGTGADVYIPVIKRDVVDFAVTADWTPATGDVTISIDGGAAANIGTLPVVNGTHDWKFVFADAELQGKVIRVRIVDSATKAVEDQSFTIETYGHASAMYKPDFSDSVRLGLTALPNAAADAAGGLPISDAGGLALDTQLANTHEITAARMGALTDWINGGRLDLIIDAILLDTAEIGAAGAGLTNINLPNQTMDITGNITGNLSGSVGSVTGNVGGSVASVTAGVTLANGAITDASLAGNMEIVFETDFATNYNTTRNAWATNVQDLVGTTALALSSSGLASITAWTVDVTGSLSGSVGSVTGAVGSVTGNVGGNVAGSVASVTGAINTASGTITTLDALDTAQDTQHGTTQTAITALQSDHPNRPARGVELANLEFMMVDATDLNTPETGITVTATIGKDGGAFASCANAVSEISGGWYKITLSSTEMTADAIKLKFTGTGCAQTNIAIRTQPT